jgi:glycosyltransferase involved in cell wall biosynthesis
MNAFLLAHPGTASFVREVAQALHEGGMLARFASTVIDDPSAPWRRAIARVPRLGARIDRELRRRSVPPWLQGRSAQYPGYELLRVAAARLDASGRLAHAVWERADPAFDRWVARTQLDGVDAVYGYEDIALHTFRAARARGLFVALDLPALAQEHVARTFERELSRWPELASEYLTRIAAHRPLRAAIVREQIGLASRVIANSALTLRSFEESGYAMGHAVVVPLAGPPPIDAAALPSAPSGPLRLLFAGTLDVRKGGHYLLEAFHREPTMRDAALSVCGRVALPSEFVRARARGVALHGHLPAPKLEQMYLSHDALVLPTLSDGFGLVVTEALAHGLPVITTDQCGAGELIEHGVNGLRVRAADIEDLMASLSWCAAHRDALHAMRAVALRGAAERTWAQYRAALRSALRTDTQQPGSQP